MTNEHDNRLLNMVRQIDPDVAWFQEVDEWWLRNLAALATTMPYHVAQAQPNYFGAALYSRYPLVDPEIRFLAGSRDPSVFTGVRLPSDQPVRLYAIHPRPPQEGQSTAERDAQILATAFAAHDDNLPHIIAGDLNAVPWEDVIDWRSGSGAFSIRASGAVFTYLERKNPVLKWPLDQILPGQAFTLTACGYCPNSVRITAPIWPSCVSTRPRRRGSRRPRWAGRSRRGENGGGRGQGNADQGRSARPPADIADSAAPPGWRWTPAVARRATVSPPRLPGEASPARP